MFNKKLFILLELVIFIVIISIIFISCSDDKIIDIPSDCDPSENVVYEGQIAMIIESKCADPLCHGGAQAEVYFDYEGLRKDLESGIFEQSVILKEGSPMPMEGSPQLTDEELALIICWKENNYAEK